MLMLNPTLLALVLKHSAIPFHSESLTTQQGWLILQKSVVQVQVQKYINL